MCTHVQVCLNDMGKAVWNTCNTEILQSEFYFFAPASFLWLSKLKFFLRKNQCVQKWREEYSRRIHVHVSFSTWFPRRLQIAKIMQLQGKKRVNHIQFSCLSLRNLHKVALVSTWFACWPLILFWKPSLNDSGMKIRNHVYTSGRQLAKTFFWFVCCQLTFTLSPGSDEVRWIQSPMCSILIPILAGKHFPLTSPCVYVYTAVATATSINRILGCFWVVASSYKTAQ